jgi:acylphosphatase
MNQKQNKAILARIYGVVQGVGFRFSTQERARRLGLKGYVRNMFDGSVEVLAEGEEPQVNNLLTWLKRGPTGSYVKRVDAHPVEYRGLYANFTIEF